VELDVYRRITRAWSAEMKQMMFPEHFRHDEKAREPSDPD
jgi:hypothetical protein